MLEKKATLVKKNLASGEDLTLAQAISCVKWSMVDVVMIDNIKAKLEFKSGAEMVLTLYDETGKTTTEIYGGVLNDRVLLCIKVLVPRTDLGMLEYEFEQMARLMSPEEKEELEKALSDGGQSE